MQRGGGQKKGGEPSSRSGPHLDLVCVQPGALTSSPSRGTTARYITAPPSVPRALLLAKGGAIIPVSTPIRSHDSPFPCDHSLLFCKHCERRTHENRGECEQTDEERRKEAVAAHTAGHANAVYTTPHFPHSRSHATVACQGWVGGLCVETGGGDREDGTERRVVYALFT
jgi:hypothetical protein